jgi:hypothetical protein
MHCSKVGICCTTVDHPYEHSIRSDRCTSQNTAKSGTYKPVTPPRIVKLMPSTFNFYIQFPVWCMPSKMVSGLCVNSPKSESNSHQRLPHLHAVQHQWQPLLLSQPADDHHQRTTHTTCRTTNTAAAAAGVITKSTCQAAASGLRCTTTTPQHQELQLLHVNCLCRNKLMLLPARI